MITGPARVLTRVLDLRPRRYRKVPSCIMYSQPSPEDEAQVIAWGLEAKNMTLQPGMVKCVAVHLVLQLTSRADALDRLVLCRCEWFKLFLSPESLRSGQPDPRLPPLPVGKNVVDVISDFLRCIWRYAKRQITDEIGSVVDLGACADVPLEFRQKLTSCLLTRRRR